MKKAVPDEKIFFVRMKRAVPDEKVIIRMKKLHRPDEKKFVPVIFQILRNIALDNLSSCILWMFRMFISRRCACVLGFAYLCHIRVDHRSHGWADQSKIARNIEVKKHTQ
jgi:hypothetical protein